MNRVLIIQKSLTHYRKPFFELLRDLCEDRTISLAVAYGNGGPRDRQKGDLVDLDWGVEFENMVLTTPLGELWWHPVLSLVKTTDLVIIEQANKLLPNFVLQAWRRVGGPHLAYWGHGRNFQGGSAMSERLKRLLVTSVDWWFAYNDLSAQVVRDAGFPERRITSVDNSVDTRGLQTLRSQISRSETESFLLRHDLVRGYTCIFCGGMYPDKKLDFLIEAGRRIHAANPDFRLLFVGNGEDRPLVSAAARDLPWARELGPLFGREKVIAFSASELQLMPGLVGLGILDSFALGVPLITTEFPRHSPEIAYLARGVNGAMLSHNVAEYADYVIALLQDPAKLDWMKAQALASASAYSIENMANRFVEGIGAALNATKR